MESKHENDFDITFNDNYIIYDDATYAYTPTQKKKLIKVLTEDYGKKSINAEVVQKIMKLKKPSSVKLDIKSSAKELLFDYIIPKKNCIYDEEHEILIRKDSGFEITDADLATYISTANDDYCKMVGKEGLTWTTEVLNNTYKEFKIDSFHEKIVHIRKHISHDLDNDYNTDALLEEMFQAMNISKSFHDLDNDYKTDSYREVAKLVFKQIIWLIKRNLFDKKTKNEIMLFFLGEQGIGKTYAFSKIFKTIFNALYIGDCKLEMLLEERMVEIWTRKLIVNFDDASVSDNVFNTKNMGEIKSKLSNDKITYRPMKSNESKTSPKKFTAVSTTNIDFKELIQDSTGARRFFQLISDNKKNEIFSADYFDGDDIGDKMKQLWISIDENNNEGFLFDKSNPLVKTLEEIQETYIKLDTQSSFHKECNFIVDEKEASEAERLSFTKAYQLYIDFCDDNNVKHKKAKRTFFKDLTNSVYWIEDKLRNGKKGKFCFVINDELSSETIETEDDDFKQYSTDVSVIEDIF